MAFQVLQRYGYEDESHHGQVQRETGTPSRPLVQFRTGGALKIPRICFPGASRDAITRPYAGRGKNAPTNAIAVRDDTGPAVRCDAISWPYLRAKGHNPVIPVSAQDSIDSQVRDEEVDAITRPGQPKAAVPRPYYGDPGWEPICLTSKEKDHSTPHPQYPGSSNYNRSDRVRVE